MEKIEGKATRLVQMEQLLLEYPEGLTRAEIARRLGVHRSTTSRYVKDLEQMGVPIWMNGQHVGVLRDVYRIKMRMTMHEALAMHLAGRLLAARMDKQNLHMASALRKLGDALKPLAPLISRHLRVSAELVEDQAKRQDPVFMNILETLTRAWSEGRKVKVWHWHDKSNLVYEYLLSPYFLEPYAVGHTIHVIGFREPPGAIRTLKVERIRRAELSHERYEIPADFDSRVLLADAWGIWYTEEAPVEVVLRFHSRVVHRIRETQWHPSETLEDQPDGSVIWRAQVAEPQEMLPWIRGWGADVEVLAPEALRQIVVRTAAAMQALYQTAAIVYRLPYQIPYAKTNRMADKVHLLLYHLIDVGQVAWVLWQKALTEGVRQQIASVLSLDVEQAGRFVVFLASLHDLGKAGPAYQDKYAPAWLKQELNTVGLVLHDISYSTQTQRDAPHGTVTAWALATLLPDVLGLEKRFGRKIGVALGGHHGIWPPPGATRFIDDSKHPRWDAVRRDIFWELRAVFSPPRIEQAPEGASLNMFLTWLSGFTSVADWIGSREEYFGYVSEPMSTRQYTAHSSEHAEKALQDLGWIGWKPQMDLRGFAEMFPFAPRPVQEQVINAALNLKQPALVILEAPTGIGKTEAALYLADVWLQKHMGRGLYVAMPTQATSNQMFGRVQRFLAHRYPRDLVNLHLAHGQATWSDQMVQIELDAIGESKAEGVAAMTWFRPRKRTLLAPFGVGTVDQTLLSILQTKHFFVRLFGLSYKVLIFDEVHAYDTFMSTLFHRLLTWLNAMGVSVIMLSATLPRQTRRELVQAYTGKTLLEDSGVYPALTIANSENIEITALTPPRSDTLQLDWTISRDPQDIVTFLRTELAKGGCAAVICNTVRRSQEVYQALKATNIVEDENLILFHARFPLIWRKAIERTVLEKFGPPRKRDEPNQRPRKAIVVATQVIEQSLDLDFDVMVTDLAPVDLILQRAGRLHRHERGKRNHPHRLVITQPALDVAGVPELGVDKYVYEPYILLRSYLVLHDKAAVILPNDTVTLIEVVYGEMADGSVPGAAWRSALNEAQQEMQHHQRKERSKAATQLIRKPGDDRLLSQSILGLEEDNPKVHETFRAQTRDIDPGISLICLYQTNEGIAVLTENGLLPIDLSKKPSADLTRQLLQNIVTLQHRAVVHYFLEHVALPIGWQRSAALRYTRPVIFENGQYYLNGTSYTLRISRRFGMEILKEEA